MLIRVVSSVTKMDNVVNGDAGLAMHSALNQHSKHKNQTTTISIVTAREYLDDILEEMHKFNIYNSKTSFAFLRQTIESVDIQNSGREDFEDVEAIIECGKYGPENIEIYFSDKVAIYRVKRG